MFVFRKLFKLIFISFFGSIFKHLFVIGFVLLFIQFPNVVDRYVNLIRGAKYETVRLQEVLGELQFKNLNSAVKKTWKDFLFLNKKNKEKSSSSSISILKLREMKYQEIGVLLEQAPLLLKPFYFVFSIFLLPEFSVLKELNFELSILLNFESLFYGLMGMILGIFIASIFSKIFRILFFL